MLEAIEALEEFLAQELPQKSTATTTTAGQRYDVCLGIARAIGYLEGKMQQQSRNNYPDSRKQG